MKLVRQFFLTILFLGSSVCLAQPASQPASKLLTVDGQAGIWFPMPTARQLLKDVAALPGLKLELELVQKRLDVEKRRSELLAGSLKLTESISQTWKETAESQAKVLASGQPWWRHPYLWAAVGLVVGVGVTVGVTALTSCASSACSKPSTCTGTCP